jgi:hypothetical protein
MQAHINQAFDFRAKAKLCKLEPQPRRIRTDGLKENGPPWRTDLSRLQW